MLCAIDEVLRGTNTVERIAASVEVLKALNERGILSMIATHDGAVRPGGRRVREGPL